jgi:hypothetical protein
MRDKDSQLAYVKQQVESSCSSIYVRFSERQNEKVHPVGVCVTVKMQAEMIYEIQHWEWRVPQTSEHGPPYLPKGKT